MSAQSRLNASIPANNQKIIEIYQKMRAGRLNVAPEFQRKLVWRRQHKIEFIETILKNFPFPEVYFAPEKVDTTKLELREQVVDGQQRLTAIQEYVSGEGVFSQASSIPMFANLEPQQKEDFLNYEVSVRYLKGATEAQIKEIFQRINRTDYSLNKMERFHAAWGDSELVCLAKQMIDNDLELNLDLVSYRVSDQDREWLLEFFGVGEPDGIFSEAEVSRMLNLQYLLVLLVTLIENSYFHRNNEVEAAVKSYNEQVPDAELVTRRLVDTTRFIAQLSVPMDSFWSTKSSLFTMVVELSSIDLAVIDSAKLASTLIEIDREVRESRYRSEDVRQYHALTREAVNEKRSRETRGEVFRHILAECRV